MNVKPGDLAVIVGASRFAGRLLQVLYLAPDAEFKLPDGMTHVRPTVLNGWVCETAGSAIEAPIVGFTQRRLARFVVAEDRYLRPIRPGDESDETPTDVILELTA